MLITHRGAMAVNFVNSANSHSVWSIIDQYTRRLERFLQIILAVNLVIIFPEYRFDHPRGVTICRNG